MKSDTERKRYHTEGLHRRKARMHVHLSKDLRGKLKVKKRAIGVRQGDTVRIMRGPHKGKDAKVSRVSTAKRKVFLEGIAVKSARGKEKPLPLEASNLLLLALEPTPERKEIFSEEAFKKKEAPKEKPAEAPKAEAKVEAKTEAKAEHKHEHAEHAHKHEAAKQHEPASVGEKKASNNLR